MHHLKKFLKRVKDKIYHFLVSRNEGVRTEYTAYVNANRHKHKSQRLQHWLVLIELTWHYRVMHHSWTLFPKSMTTAEDPLRYYNFVVPRESPDALLSSLLKYDVISFDIFDTAVFRKVEDPIDVFQIMAMEMGHNDFRNVRKKAEQYARNLKFKTCGHKEVTLDEIYQVLTSDYGIDPKWMDREIELEYDLNVRNPYIYQIFNKLLAAGKIVVFMSDMYLPLSVIEQILKNAGYAGYHEIILSNCYGKRKGDGTLQEVLLKKYHGQKIIHVGDNKSSDVQTSKSVGLNAIYNKRAKPSFRELGMSNLGGSFYRGLVNRKLYDGTWNENIHYEHGYRVGGILTTGFCNFINKTAAEMKADKVFFCSRDCDILYKAYDQSFAQYPSEYIHVSRFALFNITSERYLYDLRSRYITRYLDLYKDSKTIEQIFRECGFGYLVDYMDAADIDRFALPSAVKPLQIEQFINQHSWVVKAHNKESVRAAKKYFSDMMGDAKNILIVDIGWTGTCITALKYFLETHFPDRNLTIRGSLMATSRSEPLVNSISDGTIRAFSYSPFHNLDLLDLIMPQELPVTESDRLHMPLEYMFTSTQQSLAAYKLDANGNVVFEYSSNLIPNPQEIADMQAGILDFVRDYSNDTAPYARFTGISSYVAFNPLAEAIQRPEYINLVYGNFNYDAQSPVYSSDQKVVPFSTIMDVKKDVKAAKSSSKSGQKRILCITPELTYTGTPRSLLRMCRVALKLGYHVTVWSQKSGPFEKEYAAAGIPVKVIPPKKLHSVKIQREIRSFDMAVCNTIATDLYATELNKYLPVVWYIREATNIPDFIKNNPVRSYNLAHSKDLYCVSDYAADAIAQFTKNRISVVQNCVEDEVEMAVDYVSGQGERVKFVQFGTMEYRKGYDVLLAAYQAMPAEYQEKSELHFAGGFIYSGAPFCQYLFSKMKQSPNVHYLGLVQGEKAKIETLSSMDVIVVASRDESCSLVALEGAMLSKPLLVTENVGAKYMVNDKNGYVVPNEGVQELAQAMMRLIDQKADLAEMGRESRRQYERLASMDAYTKYMADMFALTERKNTPAQLWRRVRNRFVFSSLVRDSSLSREKNSQLASAPKHADVIVSLTSHPGRIATVAPCIESLLNQTSMPRKIFLVLSIDQFPGKEADLPSALVKLCSDVFEIKWVSGDLKPHKKYFYTAREYSELPLITVDDDVLYSKDLVALLMKSYRKFPNCVSCMRGNLMKFRDNGSLRAYEAWLLEYKRLIDIPTYQLLPTGVGGVLYPPHSIPDEAFNEDAIKETCLFADDIWLKIMTASRGYKAVYPRDNCEIALIPGTEKTALFHSNINMGGNDAAIENVLQYYDEHFGSRKELLETFFRDRFC